MGKLGILLPIPSLPGNHGIGDFGESAYKFIDWLKKNHYSYWQVLPLNPLGPGYSPYMSTCSAAIEYRYISLDLLVKDGYLSKAPKHNPIATSIDYYDVGKFKKKLLYKAYKNFIYKYPETLHKFKTRNHWVLKYGTFEVLKWHNDNKQWNEWKVEDRDYFLTHTNPPKKYLDEINFVIFMQYIALKQWRKILHYANRKKIQIISDMPFYVGFDGVECWLNRNQFSIGEDNKLFEVGGVGPDAFSEDGQLWGSPIYNFDKMKENNYSLLVDRIGSLLNNCNILRIDHFRAFDTYYVIPASEETARNGVWKIGPRHEFFNALYERYPNANLIAEDLGNLRPEVHELRDQLGLPGMYVIEFMLLDEHNSSNTNQIVYPGTHDNETLWGWFNSLPDYSIESLKNRFNEDDKIKLYDRLIEYIINAPSMMTIFQLQDVLKLDNSARTNKPGTIGAPNWMWKLKDFSFIKEIKYNLPLLKRDVLPALK